MADATRSVTVRIKAEIAEFERDMRAAANAARAVGRAAEGTTGQLSGAEGATRRTGAAAQAAATQLEGAADAAASTGAAASGATTGLDAATDAVAATGAAAETASTQLEGAAESATAAGAASAAAGQASSAGISGMLASAHANEDAWEKTGKAMLTFGAAVMVGVGLSVAKFAEFDQAMSSVDAATHETADNMDLLREKAIEVGADTAFSAKEAAQGIEELAKAGVSTSDILTGGLVGSMDLAAAGALAVGDAAEISATAMTQFKLKGSEIPHVADLLAAAAGKAQGSVQDMGMALKQSGLVASQVGLTIEETTGGLAAFASAGLIGSDAGTSFKSMLQRLTPQSKEAQKEMDALGISAYDSQGQFIGLEKFAGNLRESMIGLTNEQRNASMATIFGSDAVRAAAVIYEQGAEGVGSWIDAVNDSGYAAETAARMQNNLAGDLEKLGGSMDTVFIKGGTGASSILRGLVQGLEGLVDTVGQVPTPILAAGVAAAALIGGLALLGGAFITLVPKIAATKLAMTAFATSSPRMAAGLLAIGKGATIAAIGITAVIGASAAFGSKSVVDVDKMTSAMQDLSESGTSANDVFGEDTFLKANNTGFSTNKIRNLGDALKEVTEIDFGATVNRGLGQFLNGFGAKTTTRLTETTKAIEAMDQGLANLVNNGQGDEAAKAFVKITAAGTEAGVMADKTAGQFSVYQNALRKQAQALKVALTDEEVYQWALGNTPPKIAAVQASAEGQTAAAQAQAEANEETAKALAEVGLSAAGTIDSLGKLLDAMFATGLASMSANEATGAFHETLRALDVKIQEVIASQGVGNSIMNAAGTAFDATTASGYAAIGVFNDVATKGQNMSKAMAENGATQTQLQGSLKTTYDSLVTTAIGFGASEAKARDMAREALGIPKDVKIETAIQNYADSLAKLHGVGAAADALNGKTANVWVTTHQNSIYSETHTSNGVGGSGGQQKATGGLIQALAGGGRVKPFPMGGAIIGPGTGTSDEVPIWGSNGEFMQRTAAVKKYGIPFMESVNNLTYEVPSKSMSAGYSPAMSQSAYQPASSAAIDYDRLASVMSGGNSYSISVPKPGVGADEIMSEIKFAERRNSRGGARR